MESKDKKNAMAQDAISAQAQETVKNLQEVLGKKLSELTRLKKLADNREFFLEKKEKLMIYKGIVESEHAMFAIKSAKVIFVANNEYGREEERVSIAHPSLILKYIDTVLVDIDTAVAKIENELILKAE